MLEHEFSDVEAFKDFHKPMNQRALEGFGAKKLTKQNSWIVGLR